MNSSPPPNSQERNSQQVFNNMTDLTFREEKHQNYFYRYIYQSIRINAPARISLNSKTIRKTISINCPKKTTLDNRNYSRRARKRRTRRLPRMAKRISSTSRIRRSSFNAL